MSQHSSTADSQHSLPLKSVYIIIPVHNRKEITLACLNNLRDTGALEKYSVILIDDGSEDGTEDAVIAEYPSILLIKGTGDLWWTGAIKKGMENADNLGAEYIFWLNDDCQLSNDTLPVLIEFMQEHPHTITAPRCVAENSNLTIENGCVTRSRATANSGEVTWVDSLSGYCVGIPRPVFEAVGFPDEKKFPHYAGDDTYILRATRETFKACIVGDAAITLKNFSDPEYSFHNYLKNRFKNFPKVHDIFFKKKSRYYLHSQFYYYLEKYTFIQGLALFTAKSAMWIAQYCWLYLIHYINNANPNRS